MSGAPWLHVEVLIQAQEHTVHAGLAMALAEPISFWGGVSPVDGCITDPKSRHFGQSVAKKILFVRELRGSSSASSVLLELIYKRLAPTAIVLNTPDAILAIAAFVGREMNWPIPAFFRLAKEEQVRVVDGSWVTIDAGGELRVAAGVP